MVGHFHVVILTDRRSGVGVTIKAREITAGYIKPNPVALLEQVTGGPEVNHILIYPTGLDWCWLGLRIPVPRPDDAVLNIVSVTVWTHIY